MVLLTLLRDSLARRNGVLMDSLRRTVAREGNNLDQTSLMRLMPVLRPLFEAARVEVSAAIVGVHAILTEEQWAKVPESVKAIQLRPRMGGGPGEGRPPRP